MAKHMPVRCVLHELAVANRLFSAGILQRLIHELHEAGIVTEDLALPEESEDSLEGCYRGLCRLPHVPNSKRRRIDFLTVPYHSRGAALIYYTVCSICSAFSHVLTFHNLTQGDDIVRITSLFLQV